MEKSDQNHYNSVESKRDEELRGGIECSSRDPLLVPRRGSCNDTQMSKLEAREEKDEVVSILRTYLLRVCIDWRNQRCNECWARLQRSIEGST